MSDQLITRFIGDAKEALAQIAADSMHIPVSDPFGHGVQCGKYQGVEFALDILNDILRDNLEKERDR
jgi:hypothetical protein